MVAMDRFLGIYGWSFGLGFLSICSGSVCQVHCMLIYFGRQFFHYMYIHVSCSASYKTFSSIKHSAYDSNPLSRTLLQLMLLLCADSAHTQNRTRAPQENKKYHSRQCHWC